MMNVFSFDHETLEASGLTLEDAKLAVEPYLRKLSECSTPDEIRDILVGEKIKAVQGRVNKCAVSKYVTQKTDVLVCVHSRGAYMPEFGIVRTPGKSGGTVVNYAGELPGHNEVLRRFIRKFDDGDYPELVDRDYQASGVSAS
jgi:hypothetical protein